MDQDELIGEGAKLLEDSVRELPAEDIDRILRTVPPAVSTELVKELIGSKLDPRRLKKLGPLLVSPLRKRPAERLAGPVEALSVGILETFHAELGDRFDDPSLADLREVLDSVLAQHPPAGVRCTLAWVCAEGMPAARAARELLLSDARLRLPEWPEPPAAESDAEVQVEP